MRFSHSDSPLVVAAAQTLPVAGDLAANLRQHLAFVQAAALHKVNLLLFPELSLIGYEPDHMASHVMDVEDMQYGRLAPLREAAMHHGMALVVGAAVVPDAQASAGHLLPSIGALVFHPSGHTEVYRKHHLHGGEERFASPGAAAAHVTTLASQPVGLAVCADITHAEHAQAASVAGAALYACSMLLSEKGYAPESAMLQSCAREHGMAVLMANFGAPSGGYQCAGRSALWAEGGSLVVEAEGVGSCLVVGRRQAGSWMGSVIPVQVSLP